MTPHNLLGGVLSSYALFFHIPQMSAIVLFLVWGHTQRYSQGLLPPLSSGITPGGIRGTYGTLRINAGLAVCKANTQPAVLSFYDSFYDYPSPTHYTLHNHPCISKFHDF